MMLLIVVANMYICTKRDRTTVGRNKVIDDLKDRGFPCTVITNDGYVFASFNIHADILEQGKVIEGFGKMLYMKNIISTLTAGSQCHMDISPGFSWLFKDFNLIQHLFPAFCPFDGFFTIKAFQLFNDCLLMTDLLLLVQIGISCSSTQNFLFGCVSSVIAKEGGSLCLINFNDLAGKTIQKITVMGNSKNGTLIIQKIVFKPGNCIQVEMVCWLIEDDQLRFFQEEL